MRFCENCGSFMQRGSSGFECPKCGDEIIADSIEVKRTKKETVEPVYVVENPGNSGPVVNQNCPQCDGTKAYRKVLTTQGEHAGVKQDRSVERYACVECGHIWVKS